MTDADSPAKELLSDSFSFPYPTLLFAQVRLFEDRLELTGWRLWERYRRRIPLHRILQVDVPNENCLLLWMADGQTVRLRIDNAQRWQQVITRRLEEV